MYVYVLADVSNRSCPIRRFPALKGLQLLTRGGGTQPGLPGGQPATPPRFPAGFTSAYAGFTAQTQSSGRAGRGGGGEAPLAPPRARSSRPAPRRPPAPPPAPQHSLTPALSAGESPGDGRESRPAGPRRAVLTRSARPQQAAAAGRACGDRGGEREPGQTLRRLPPASAETRLHSPPQECGAATAAGAGVEGESAASPRPQGSGGGPGCLRRSAGPGLGGAGRERTSAGRRHGG